MQPPYLPPATSPAPRISEWLNEALSLFGRNWLTWCAQGLLYAVLPALLIAIGFAPLLASLVSLSIRAAGQTTPPSADALIPGALVLVAALPLTLLLLSYLLVGMMRTAAKQLRGEPIAVGDLFQAGSMSTVLRALGASLVVGLAVIIGLLFFVVPGLLLAGLFFFVHPLIVERGVGVGPALRESIRLTQPHLVGYTLWVLLIYVIQAVGSAVGCGVIATVPLMVLMWMIAYRDATGDPLLAPAPAPAAIAPPEIRPRNEG